MHIEGKKAGIFRMFPVRLVSGPATDGRTQPCLNLFQILLYSRKNAVLRKQRIFPSGDHIAFLTAQTEAQPIAMFDLIAHIFHEHKELTEAAGILNSGAEVRFQQGAEGGLASGLAEPLNVTDGV